MFHPPALPAVLSSKLGSINKLADAEKVEMRQTSAETPPKRNARFNVTVCINPSLAFLLSILLTRLDKPFTSPPPIIQIRADNASVFFYYI
jgi:hypothetical protein